MPKPVAEETKPRLGSDLTKMTAKEIAEFRDRFKDYPTGVKYRLANHVLRLMKSPLVDKNQL